MLFHYFDRFLAEYESRFEREYGFLRPIIKEVTAGHHEARRAVVISEGLGKNMRLPRRSAPRNDASTAATPAAGLPASAVPTAMRNAFSPGGTRGSMFIAGSERLSFDEREGKVCYRYGEGADEVERMDYLEFIARVTSHIPDKGQVTIRYSGPYANAHRGKRRKAEKGQSKLLIKLTSTPIIFYHS